jgi:putative flippase GtrA
VPLSSTAAMAIAATSPSEVRAAAERRRIAQLRRGTHFDSEATALSLQALTGAMLARVPREPRSSPRDRQAERVANLHWMRDDATTVDLRPAKLDGTASVGPQGAAEIGSPDAAESRLQETSVGGPRVHTRLLHGLRRPANWLQLIRFSIVGASGYAVNLLLYAFFVKELGVEYLVAEAAAWIIAAANNFVWNRHWTFKAGEGQVHLQALRFFLVSLVALAFNLLVLRVLVESAGLDKVAAEVLALGASTPLSFLGNKLWSFKLDLYSESSPPRED